MYFHIDTKKPSNLSAWCGFLLALYCLFRKANLCPKNSGNNPSVVLKHGDLEIDEELEKVLVYINFYICSKAFPTLFSETLIDGLVFVAKLCVIKTTDIN